MQTAIRWVPVLAALAFFATSPALAVKGGGGKGHAFGHSKGGGGGSKGTPAPIAGLGILALGAIGYGARKLKGPKQK